VGQLWTYDRDYGPRPNKSGPNAEDVRAAPYPQGRRLTRAASHRHAIFVLSKAANRAICSLHRRYQRPQRPSDGQQQPSTPLFGFGASASMSISNGQPVIGAPVIKSVSVTADVPMKKSVFALFLTTTEGKKISIFVGFGRGTGRANASVLVALSDAFADDVVEGRLLSGWSFQQRLEPCW